MEKHALKRIVLTVALLASLLAGGALLVDSNVMAPVSSQASATSVGAVGAASAQEAIRTVKLKVDGLWCASCAYIARQAFIGTPGVLDARVSGRTKTAVVTYDPTKVDLETLIAATTNFGYPSQVLVQ